MTISETNSCRWCGCRFARHRGGSPQLFCAASCRHQFHSATRRWAERAIAAGQLNIDALMNGDMGACTLLMQGRKPEPVLESGFIDHALLATLRVQGRVRVTLPVSPEGRADLISFGWLSASQSGDSRAVADALIDVANAALAAGLRPASQTVGRK